jgi:signal transduction histidine kinase
VIAEPRPTGIDGVGDMPWGTHFCHFYQTEEDLADILMPYFRTGLEANEFCMMVLFHLTVEEARETFRRSIPKADEYVESGAMEFVPHSEWYLRHGVFDLQRVMEGWQAKLDQAIAKGYSGMRVNGNEAWVTEQEWDAFADYEHRLNQMLVGRRMLVMCTYPLRATTAAELFDVARTHQFAIARNNGSQEVFETPDLRLAKEELRKLNAELEKRVEERTRELNDSNVALALMNEKLRESERQLRALSSKVLSAREEEGTRIARELHDELGSALTGLKWELEALNHEFSAWRDQPEQSALQRRTRAMVKLADAMIGSVRRIASELRPSILDDLGLVDAIEWLAAQFRSRTGIQCRCRPPAGPVDLTAEQSTAVFRIFQETLTNILRHARATEIEVSMDRGPDKFTLTVKDDGRGFDEADEKGQSLGLLGMRERARLIGGKVEILSEQGGGTTVLVEIPLGRAL